jgi:branched-chain amino acid transport system permease protein
MNREKLVKTLVLVLVLVLVCLLPPIVRNDYWIHVLILIVIMILVTASLRAIFRTGEISIGISGFMLLGGYSSALLTLNLGLSFWITMPLGGLFAAAVAAAIGYPFFRVKGIYFAISTLLLAFVFLYLAGYMRDLTGGWQGLVFDIWPNPITIPGIMTLTFDTDTSYYYLAITIVGLCLFILYRMERARVGLVWGSIREADNLAQSVGVNLMAHKIFIFVVACFFTGIAGALYAFYVHALSPTTTPANIFSFFTSVYCILYMVVGGEGNFFGPIIGTTLFMLIPEFSRPLQMYRPLIYGALLILIIFFMPEGLIGLGDYFTTWYRKLFGRSRRKVQSQGG